MGQKASTEQGSAYASQPRLYLNKISKKSWPLIYSPNYDISFAGVEKLHPFDSGKWGRVHAFLIERGLVDKKQVVAPLEANEEELLRVHTKEYLDSLNWSAVVARIVEMPPIAMIPNYFVQRSLLKPMRFHTGGSILAGKLAMERGWAVNIGGGFHHCSATRGGGFCVYADITLNIRYLWQNFPDVSKVLIVDLDAHQGNGYARDFMDEKEKVFILDVYNHQIYPNDTYAKAAISRKIEIYSRTGDDKYLNLVKQNVSSCIEKFCPQYIVYNAGTDILDGDPLGNLCISADGVIKRDEIVFEAARKQNIPIVMFTSGGYQKSNAGIIADSISNLHSQGLINGPPHTS